MKKKVKKVKTKLPFEFNKKIDRNISDFFGLIFPTMISKDYTKWARLYNPLFLHEEIENLGDCQACNFIHDYPTSFQFRSSCQKLNSCLLHLQV